jgi:hypothetical protein
VPKFRMNANVRQISLGRKTGCGSTVRGIGMRGQRPGELESESVISSGHAIDNSWLM